jgi:hypothetical protein
LIRVHGHLARSSSDQEYRGSKNGQDAHAPGSLAEMPATLGVPFDPIALLQENRLP